MSAQSNAAAPSSSTAPDQSAQSSAAAPSSSTTPDQSAQSNATQGQQSAGGNLPQTASPLPLLSLLGLGSIGVGLLSRKKK
jgi:LPXTG-motif cell wall-anchored protein